MASTEEGGMEEVYDAYEEGNSVVLGIVVALLVALLIRTVTTVLPHKWHIINLPYTAILLLAGGAVGAIAANTAPVAYITEGVKDLESISPSVLLTVFLPALITPSGINMRWHVVRLTLDKALLLAIPGTLFNSAMIALIARYIFPYDWSWAESWLFASILAAVDPVAVVAIMHSTAASVKLATMIEGESLLNDGVAFVLFEVFIEWASGERITAGNTVAFVFKSCFGSPSLGFVWAIALTLWFIILFSDKIAEIVASVVASYALWILSDEILGISGILALVAFGMSLSAFGIYRISHKAEKEFFAVWQLIGWIADTLIFFIAGLIIAVELSEVQSSKVINSRDWGYAIALYILIILARGFSIFLMYPLLQLGIYGATWKDCIMLAWVGLRGALGLALSLIVYYSNVVGDTEYRQKQFFFVAVIASATLLIQGSTTPFFLNKLGYHDLPPAQRDAMQRCAEAVEMLGIRGVMKAKEPHALLGDADWERVHQLTHLGVARRLQRRPTHSGHPLFSSPKILHRDDKGELQIVINHSLILADLRERLLRTLISHYHCALESDLVTPHEAHVLISASEKALDVVQDSLQDWEYVIPRLESTRALERKYGKYVKWWKRVHAFIKAGRRRAGRDASIAAAFACAHAEARRELQAFTDLEFGGLEAESLDNENDNLNSMSLDVGGGMASSQSLQQESILLKPDEISTVKNNNSTLSRPSVSSEDQADYAGDDLKALWQTRDDTNKLLRETRVFHHRMPSMLRRVATSKQSNVTELWTCLDQVLNESREEQNRAEEHIKFVKMLHPKAVRDVRTLQVAMEALHHEQNLLERLKHEGLLEEREVNKALQLIDRRLKTIHFLVAFEQ